MWIIQCTNNSDLFWSNTWGWTDKEDADKFSNDEKNRLNLPLEGQWKQSEVDQHMAYVRACERDESPR